MPAPKKTPKRICRKILIIYGIIALIAFLLKLFGAFPQFYKEGGHSTVKFRGLQRKEKVLTVSMINGILGNSIRRDMPRMIWYNVRVWRK